MSHLRHVKSRARKARTTSRLLRRQARLVANHGTRKKPGSTGSATDPATFVVATTIETGASAHGVLVDRDGRLAYMRNIYANTVSVIDLTQLKVVHTARVGKGPNGIGVTL